MVKPILFASDTATGSSCSQESCGCMSRRDFLVLSGLGTAALMLSPAAGSGAPGDRIRVSPHLIPRKKNLPIGWLRSLTEKGEKEFWSGAELKTIGMPIGGIATGQMYLCGDGTLGCWEIFNQHEFIGWGPRNYARRAVRKPVEHGIALLTEADGNLKVRRLDESGFGEVRFRGEYPIGFVEYDDRESPVSVSLEAFSPFIPLNAHDSALPATLMHVTLQNHSNKPATVSLLSWLENPIARRAGFKGYGGRRKTQIVREENSARIIHSAVAASEEKDLAAPRPAINFANFNDGNFGDWKITGAGFGQAPAIGRLENQQPVAGFEGSGFVNSFHGGDDPTGRMISPKFTVSRRYINFLIGGGNQFDLVGMRLVLDGESVRSATGGNSEQLHPDYWDVSEYEGREAQLEIYDESGEAWGHVLIDQIVFSDEPHAGAAPVAFEAQPDFGTLVWACSEPVLSPDDVAEFSQALPEEYRSLLDWNVEADVSLTTKHVAAFNTKPVKLAPGESKTIVFQLAWHFPNTFSPSTDCGHEYAARFADANEVSSYVLKHYDRLAGDTRKWRDTWYDSTLPVWLLDRLHLTIDCLATGTAQWWKNGRFWGWEGVVCCEGTCTHVWNYAQSMARLFPHLERTVREMQDLGVGLKEDGLVGFRHNGIYAADGQCGTVLKVWREHLMSADDGFLRRNWESVKKVLDYLIQQDANGDGLIENRQHNTYDIDFYGANTFVGALYLGALRAGERMARELGEMEYADELNGIYETGRANTEERLWNGEYFTQEVNLSEHPEWQYGPGCLSDQMFGQCWAHQTGLGYLYSSDKVQRAMRSVWEYNWAPDVGLYNEKYPPERSFAEAAEAGLFICTWPTTSHMKKGVRYRDEVWTGIEYQAAAGMIYEGMITEGLALCRAVHDRYHPAKRNPYNEIECSDYYARAMSSWGVLLALSGFDYHGPKGQMTFAPRITPEQFRCAFTSAEGWGSFTQELNASTGKWKLEVRHGAVKLTSISLGTTLRIDNVMVNGRTVKFTPSAKNGMIQIQFAEPVVLNAGEAMEIRSA